jgi:hypothetical protein
VDAKNELIDTNTNLEQMKRIAEITGGACLSVQELTQLTSLVNYEPITTTVRSERALWDNGLVALLLIALLGAEWILRRKHDLP